MKKQYIDKETLINKVNALTRNPIENDSYDFGWNNSLENVKAIINTIDPKEVELEKEVEDWVKTGPHTSYPWCTIPDAIRITAEHFFELGLKTRKEE